MSLPVYENIESWLKKNDQKWHFLIKRSTIRTSFDWYIFVLFFQDGRVLSDPFIKLPTRRELPDYYEVIKRPVDINKIINKIDDAKVETFLIINEVSFISC